MCFKRKDARKVKELGIIAQAGGFFMPTRAECVNYFMEDFRCEGIDDFIAREKKNGVTFSYLHVMMAAIVKLYYLRPRLNYFINNCVTYEHNNISISMALKSNLSDNGEEVMMKLDFTGRESIYEVKEIVDKGISSNLEKGDSDGGTGKAANFLNHIPAWAFRLFMKIARWLDKHNLLPKAFIKASPFHCSCFLTYLKSLKQETVHHHLYNFGTCSVFVAMGKEKMRPVVEGNKDLKVGKVMQIGFSLDDRNADGFYYSKSVKMLKEMVENPDCLKEGMPDDGSKVLKIKKKRKTSKSKKTKERKNKTLVKKSKKRSEEQKEKQKALKKQIREQKEEVRAKIKAEKEKFKQEKEYEKHNISNEIL